VIFPDILFSVRLVARLFCVESYCGEQISAASDFPITLIRIFPVIRALSFLHVLAELL
jgi:hypothetical protein